MKIYGYLPVYEMALWVGHCIENLLDFVDVLVIGEGFQGLPTTFGGNRSTDGTCEVLAAYKDHPKIKIIKNPWSINVRLGLGSCHRKVLRLFRKLGIEEGDWYFLCDSDEFYSDKQKSDIRKTFKMPGVDLVAVHDRMFIYNAHYYIEAIHPRFFRYTKGMKFSRYGQYACYEDGKRYEDNKQRHATILKDEPMYHFSWVHPNEREKKRRIMEIKARVWDKSIMDWYEQVYLGWHEKNAEKIYAVNKRISGGTGWFYGDDKRIKTYEGTYPRILRNHPILTIDDIRQFDQKGIEKVQAQVQADLKRIRKEEP